MALTASQKVRFRNWMIKSASVPILTVVVILIYWPWDDSLLRFPDKRFIEFHFFAALCLLFGGFPMWNVILEKNRFWLFVYHGSHFSACAFVFLYSRMHLYLPEPAEFCMVIASWCLAKQALIYLMPETDKEVDDLANWRQDTLNKMVDSHYHRAEK
jgi:hypothetical protein